mgnify:FL=1
MADWTKHDNPVLDNAQDDEPLFVLRAQDLLSPVLVEEWADLVEAHADPDKCSHEGQPCLCQKQKEKVNEARRIARLMRAWATKNTTKFPD